MWPVACNDCYWYITNLIIYYLQQIFYASYYYSCMSNVLHKNYK